MTLLPALSILILALFALLPWGGGDTARFAAAMMPPVDCVKRRAL